MDHIAGIGYRKALEFLVKDYAIKSNPDDEQDISTSPLGSCIKNYIDNEKIRSLAQKSAWIGNDEAHYIRKHEDRDVNDLKKFIKAIVYYISMELTVADADSIESH